MIRDVRNPWTLVLFPDWMVFSKGFNNDLTIFCFPSVQSHFFILDKALLAHIMQYLALFCTSIAKEISPHLALDIIKRFPE